MLILGIDPGYAIIGYGFVESNGTKLHPVEYGAITTPAKTDFSVRLNMIFNGMNEILDKHRPDALSIEKLYFNTNTTTAIEVAEARGVILLSAKMHNVPVFEYTPLQVKQSVTGYGKAQKMQVMEMVKHLLNLKAIPKPDDTADALAMAICHTHYGGSALGKILMEGAIK